MSTWTEVRDGVEKILPFAVGAINPALGGILGAALGTKSDPDSISQALQNDPQAEEKLLAFKAQIQIAVISAGVATIQADAASQDSARKLAMAKSYAPQVVLSTVFVTGYFSLVFLLVWALFTGAVKMDTVNPAILTIVTSLLGVLTASVVQIMNFWFGSSHGSQKKDDALAQAALSP